MGQCAYSPFCIRPPKRGGGGGPSLVLLRWRCDRSAGIHHLLFRGIGPRLGGGVWPPRGLPPPGDAAVSTGEGFCRGAAAAVRKAQAWASKGPSPGHTRWADGRQNEVFPMTTPGEMARLHAVLSSANAAATPPRPWPYGTIWAIAMVVPSLVGCAALGRPLMRCRREPAVGGRAAALAAAMTCASAPTAVRSAGGPPPTVEGGCWCPGYLWLCRALRGQYKLADNSFTTDAWRDGVRFIGRRNTESLLHRTATPFLCCCDPVPVLRPRSCASVDRPADKLFAAHLARLARPPERAKREVDHGKAFDHLVSRTMSKASQKRAAQRTQGTAAGHVPQRPASRRPVTARRRWPRS